MTTTRRDEVKEELKKLAMKIVVLQREPSKTEEDIKEHRTLSRLLMAVEDISFNLATGIYD